MIMITGGAFQGKRTFAKEFFSLNDSDMTDCADCDAEKLGGKKCIFNYELAVKRLIENDIDPIEFSRRLDCGIVIINEIGCGIIPLEKSERIWREMTGRAGCIIAERSEKVYRICCGAALKIKDDTVKTVSLFKQ